MKKASKILSLLAVAAFLTACDTEQKAPKVISLDLSDAVALFNGNGATEGEETDFNLYKTNESGVTKRVHIKTKRSDDDKYFLEKPIHTDLLEMSDEYFFARIGGYDSDYNYFVNKKTGQAYQVEGDYSFHRYGYWLDSTNPIRDFSKDSNGNLYGKVYDYKSKHEVLAKIAVTDKKVKVEIIGNAVKEEIDRPRFNDYAADKDGNVAYFGDGNWQYVSVDKNIVTFKDKKAVWTGYDGEIYSYNKNGTIEKLSYDKDKSEVVSTAVIEYPELKDADFINMKILYIDKTQQIYAYTTGSNYELVLYQIYGENLDAKPIVYTTEDLSYPKAADNYFIINYGYSYSGVECDEDCIYVTTYDNDEFVINKIDTSKNMEHSQIRFKVDYLEGTRFLNNKKMHLFWWGHDQIYDDKSDSLASMSVSILDLNTGKMSEQDPFLTGNSDRSSVINLKSYK